MKFDINVTVANGSPVGLPVPLNYQSVPWNSVMRASLAYPFTSLDGVIIDPDNVIFTVTPPTPSGSSPSSPTVYTYTYGAATPDPTYTIIRTGVGMYYADIDNSSQIPGIWTIFIDGQPVGITQSDSITAVAGNGTTLTYTCSNTFSPGQLVSITGITGSTSGPGYDGVKLVATSSLTQFTVTDSTLGTPVLSSALATNVFDSSKTKIHYSRNVLVNNDNY